VKTDDTSAFVLELRDESKGELLADRQMTGEDWKSYLKSRSEELVNKNGVDLVTVIARSFGRIAREVVLINC